MKDDLYHVYDQVTAALLTCIQVTSNGSPYAMRPLSSLSVCDVGVLWPNGWMHQDATWYGGRPRPMRHSFRWGPSSPPRKGAQQPPPLFGSRLLWPNGRPSHQLMSTCLAMPVERQERYQTRKTCVTYARRSSFRTSRGRKLTSSPETPPEIWGLEPLEVRSPGWFSEPPEGSLWR